ncbi:hypothetical protein [Chitinophaga sp. Cy-1792]|uniref:hypothetical protein n=1 Tax=Chitinophaga sp. Cy-1792 TaxID=2608339 RepID=UPI001423E95B|nr:hypothetical protein [Chitinophaga sp. Cy-1792]NIG54874.1 hypothetical protein [Chitinophaga sp. Cy-1792]
MEYLTQDTAVMRRLRGGILFDIKIEDSTIYASKNEIPEFSVLADRFNYDQCAIKFHDSGVGYYLDGYKNGFWRSRYSTSFNDKLYELGRLKSQRRILMIDDRKVGEIAQVELPWIIQISDEIASSGLELKIIGGLLCYYYWKKYFAIRD